MINIRGKFILHYIIDTYPKENFKKKTSKTFLKISHKTKK